MFECTGLVRWPACAVVSFFLGISGASAQTPAPAATAAFPVVEAQQAPSPPPQPVGQQSPGGAPVAAAPAAAVAPQAPVAAPPAPAANTGAVPAEGAPASSASLNAPPDGAMQTSGEPEVSKPRRFAIGLATLKEHGFGALMRVRFDHIALDAAAGFLPVIIITQTYDGTTVNIDGALPLHASVGPVFFLNNQYKGFQNGLRVNGIYNALMGPGAGAGWVGEVTKTSFTLGFGAGLQVYPNAEDKIRNHFHYGSDIKLDATTTVLQIYAGLNLLWYVL